MSALILYLTIAVELELNSLSSDWMAGTSYALGELELPQSGILGIKTNTPLLQPNVWTPHGASEKFS